MEPIQAENTLLVAAQLAITLTGFTGIVAFLGRRGSGEWQPQEQLRLGMLLGISLSAALFACLPILVSAMGIAPEQTWRACSLVLGLLLLALHPAIVYRIRRLPKQGVADEFPLGLGIALFAGSLLVALLLGANATGVVYYAAPGPYLLGVFWLLVLSAVQFIRLVTLRP